MPGSKRENTGICPPSQLKRLQAEATALVKPGASQGIKPKQKPKP